MFLDLKEGAVIVSLKPFVPEGFRMTESNVRFAWYFRQTELPQDSSISIPKLAFSHADPFKLDSATPSQRLSSLVNIPISETG